MSFVSLGLSAELLHAVADQGYSKPTPVQSRAIPVILQGKDILAGAQTGTGKTAGFALPLLQLLSGRGGTKAKNSVRALILTPTRELAAQVEESVAAYGKYLPLKSTVIFGGVNIRPQIEKLRQGVDILVATPGRLLDHVQQRTLNLSQVEILVLDEADRMLDMGFIRDIRRILTLLPGRRQNLLFFATFSDDIKNLADDLLNSPELIEAGSRNTASETIEQMIHPVDRTRKRELLSFLINSQKWRQVLVFTRTKHGADKLTKLLGHDGIKAAAIHGNKSQANRTRALADFKHGDVRVLVATDIAARGLDIEHLPHVVNFELPNVPEDYVHRIGRTGRAERAGIATSLVCIDERDLLKDIERLIKRTIPREIVEGYEPDPSIPAEPIFKGGSSLRQRSGGNYLPGKYWSKANAPDAAAGRKDGFRRKRTQDGPKNEEPMRGSGDIPGKRVMKARRGSPGCFGIPRPERP
ncbi:MAG: DEAD/DEAH box helicase [Syntrophobacter sp.]